MYAEQIAPFPLGPDAAMRPDIRAYVDRLMTRQPPGEGVGFAYDPDTITRIVAQQLHELSGPRTQPKEVTIGQFVVKTVTDCNLRCVYPCYEYVNDSWRELPPVMPDQVVTSVGMRIGEHAVFAGLEEVDVVLHGGEPLFTYSVEKPEIYYDRVIPLLRASIGAVAPGTKVNIDMQTNGTLLRLQILDVLKRHNVTVGVSLDGNKAAHDAYRLTKDGKRGSHHLVVRGLALLSMPEYAHLARSLLCVINIDSDPFAVDDFLREHAPPGLKYIDYTLPYATHDKPPRQPSNPANQSETPYADWLLKIFWRSLRREAPHIRLFQSITRLAHGLSSRTEAIGPDAGGEVVIRTDGSYELVDALKVTAPNSVATDMGVASHSIEDVAKLMRRSGHLGRKVVASACKPCPVFEVCGGGHIASRYSEQRLFDNASVYCKDLKVLTEEVSRAARYHTVSHVAHALSDAGVPPDSRGCC
jgi:uncharacterized protein